MNKDYLKNNNKIVSEDEFILNLYKRGYSIDFITDYYYKKNKKKISKDIIRCSVLDILLSDITFTNLK